MQPTYLPWIGFFDLIDQSDIFVFYNDVQYVKGQWGSRNRIKTANGEVFLTVPTKKSPLNTPHNKIELVNNKPWKKKHLKTLFYTYQKTEYFREVYDFLEKVLKEEHLYLSDFNENVIKKIASRIGIKKTFIQSSTLNSKKGTKDERLVDICNELHCNTYLSPFGASSYIEEKNPGGEFSKNNINLRYQNYDHPKYKQSFGDFKSHMSIVDLMFYEGFDRSLEIIRSGRKKALESFQINSKE